MQKKISIHWFREDLRLQDNPALSAAFEAGAPVLGLYIFDEVYKIGSAQKIWLHYSLKSLKKSLKEHSIPFLIESGDPLAIWEKLLKQHCPKLATWNRSYVPSVSKRDQKIRHLLENENVKVLDYNGTLLIDPCELVNKTGGFYKVFAPFFRCHQKIYEPQRITRAPKNQAMFKIDSCTVDQLHLLDKAAISPDLFQKNWEPGEAGAHQRLKAFARSSLAHYDHHRNFPALDETSRLSPHLHFGEISPHAVVRAVHGNTPFIRELVFRDFASYLLYHCPDLPVAPFKKEFATWKWSHDRQALKAWKKGETGYPLVDAGMRELLKTGFMHNRVRMVVASFLIKDLNLSWQEGAEWFLDRLLDADIGNNSYNWQWSAGTGLDAQPFFRIFNPLLQSEKFDPDGVYIKQWVPELRTLSSKFIHAPFKAPAAALGSIKLGKDYPLPIVEHDEAKRFALKEYRRIVKSAT